jgi:orotidine-5'-phosphate decarboxylase
MASDKIIVALDFDKGEQALRLAGQIKEYLSCVKVGSQLFTREGPALVLKLREMGLDVFLDLKFHDIPETVRKAVKAAAALDLKFLTIHATGGRAMIEGALAGAAGTRTTVLGVTVLTSLDDAAIAEIGYPRTAAEQVVHAAKLGRSAGLPGFVCSPLEIETLRKELGQEPILVTPGIRGIADAKGDQKRTLSAAEALKRGASHLVVGRPITGAPDPVRAAAALLEEIS